MREKVFFSLGSNKGDKRSNIEQGMLALSSVCQGFEASRIFETDPLYITTQPAFLNCVASGILSESPEALLFGIHTIERRLGRKRGKHFGPRMIDIDILLYGRRIIRGKDIVIPHPRMKERRFVLIPLLELDSGLTDPLTGVPFWKYLEKTLAGGVYFHAFSRYTKGSLRSIF